MGLLNIICSPYLFFSQQAFNLTLCAQFVLLPAPCFPFLTASVFVFMPEGDPLRLCVDTCAGGAAAGTVHSLPPCALAPQPGAPCPPGPTEGLRRVFKPRHHCPPCLGGRGQVLGSREGELVAPAACRRGSGLASSPPPCWSNASTWGEPQLYLPCGASSYSSSFHASCQPCRRETQAAGRPWLHSPAESDLSADIAGRNKAIILSPCKQQGREDCKARLPRQQGASLGASLALPHHSGAGSCALRDEPETCLFSCSV